MSERAPGLNGQRWNNWSGLASGQPSAVHTPRNEPEILELVRRAHEAGSRLRVVGGAHSFTDLVATNDDLVSLEKFQGLTSVNTETCEATIRGGTYLYNVGGLLAEHGLALPNMGDIDRQSLAGALSTATHGTGLDFTTYSGMVTRLKLALADGTTTEVSPGNPLFDAARVGLGTMGIILEATLKLSPAFALRAEERPVPLADALAHFPDWCREHDHVEFFWFQGTDTVVRKINTRLPADTQLDPLTFRQHWIDDELIGNGLHRAMCEIGRLIPAAVPRLNRLAASKMSNRTYTDRSDKVFISPRRTRFAEMEYSVPFEAFEDVFGEIVHTVNNLGYGLTFPLEVRAVKGDDTMLSPATGGDRVFIATHQFIKEEHRQLFATLEPIFRAAGGRPHWGKLHTLSAADVADSYPRFDEFLTQRAHVDSDGLFLNPYVSRLLGVTGR